MGTNNHDGVLTHDNFDHGRNSDIDLVAERLTTTSLTIYRGILVKAANSNTGNIYVGNSDVTADSNDATDGFELGPGESVQIEVDNIDEVYVIADTANQVAYWITV